MTSQDTQKILALEAGLAPTRRSVYEDPRCQKDAPFEDLSARFRESETPAPFSFVSHDQPGTAAVFQPGHCTEDGSFGHGQGDIGED